MKFGGEEMKKTVLAVSLVFVLAVGFAFWGAQPSFAQGNVIRWKMQSVEEPGMMEYKILPVRFADRVRELSGGRLEIKVYPPGGIVPSFEVWDAVRKGVLEMSHHYLVYWNGKEPALKAANDWPAMVEPLQGMIWFNFGGGNEITRKILEKHGLYYIGASPMEREHIWSRKPLKGVADLKGLKMRAAALAADSFAALGASIVTVPGGEIYQALERGVVDAAEYTWLTANFGLGMAEVTKYIVFPTFSGGGNYDWFANMDAWKKLPDDLKKIVEVAQQESTYLFWLQLRLETEKLMQVLEKKGITFITWSPEDVAKLETARYQMMEKHTQGSPLYAEKFKSQMQLLHQLGYKTF
jgi:TRAP-type mannitol/chloroaromatic compound transport system substrate-binding protein